MAPLFLELGDQCVPASAQLGHARSCEHAPLERLDEHRRRHSALVLDSALFLGSALVLDSALVLEKSASEGAAPSEGALEPHGCLPAKGVFGRLIREGPGDEDADRRGGH